MHRPEIHPEQREERPDDGTLAPVPRRDAPTDEVEIRQQDPWGSARGLLVLIVGVIGVLVLGWGLGILAVPGGQVGIAECERTCQSIGTSVASFEGGVCICNEL